MRSRRKTRRKEKEEEEEEEEEEEDEEEPVAILAQRVYECTPTVHRAIHLHTCVLCTGRHVRTDGNSHWAMRAHLVLTTYTQNAHSTNIYTSAQQLCATNILH